MTRRTARRCAGVSVPAEPGTESVSDCFLGYSYVFFLFCALLLRTFFLSNGTKKAPRAVRGSLSVSFDGMIQSHFCVARIRDFGQGSDDCAYIIPHPFAKINTILSKFVQVCPTCAQKHCTRKQISIASGSYPFCAAFFFMLLLAIQLDTDFMIFKAAQLRKSVIRLIFKFTRPFTSTLYPIKRTMSTRFGIMSLQSSTILFPLTKACKQIIRTAFY